jgi:hypothetical protein
MIEVMIASAVLLLGTVMIHESYLRTADLFSHYSNTLKVRSWMNEQAWAARESLVYSQTPSNDPQSGIFVSSERPYNWSQDVSPLSGPNLYTIRLSVLWSEGNRPLNLTKEIYAFKKDTA